MRIKVSTVKELILYYMILYMFNKNLWDYYLGSIAKNLYYGLLLLGAIFGIYMFMKKKQTRIISIFFIVYVIIVVINGFTISNANQRTVGFMEYLVYPLSFFSINYLLNPQKKYTNIIKLIIFWGVITSVLSVYESIVAKPLLDSFTNRTYRYYTGISAHRSIVFIGSPMVLAFLLGISMIMAIYLSEYEHKKKYRICIVVIFIGIIATGSRAPLLSTIMGAVLMYYYREKIGRNNKKLIIAFISLFLFGFFILLFSFAFPNLKVGISFVDTAISRFGSTFNFSSEWGNVERITRWKYYLKQFIRNPFYGYGIASTSAAVSTNNMKTISHGITTESGVIGRLVETGLLGCVPYYCMFFLSIKLSFSELKMNAKLKKDNLFYLFIGIIIVFLIEDAVLQISLDIFSTFAVWFAIAFGYNRMRYLKNYNNVFTE